MMYNHPLIKAKSPVQFNQCFQGNPLLHKLCYIDLNQNALIWYNGHLNKRCQCIVLQHFQSGYLIVEKVEKVFPKAPPWDHHFFSEGLTSNML